MLCVPSLWLLLRCVPGPWQLSFSLPLLSGLTQLAVLATWASASFFLLASASWVDSACRLATWVDREVVTNNNCKCY